MTATTVAPGTAVAGPTSATFRAIGTNHRILVTEPGVLIEAVALTKEHLAELDLAVSRFRPDSEVSRLAARAATGDTWCFASPLLADHVIMALRAARLSAGLVDPTVGSALVANGYDADLSVVRARRGIAPTGAIAGAGAGAGAGAEFRAAPGAPVGPSPAVPGWQRVFLDERTQRLSTPRGILLDFGATAKARAADSIAALLAGRLPGGFLVNLGGDIAVSGVVPDGGWRIGVEAADGDIRQVVTSTGQAMATSSTRLRTWTAADGEVHHHIVDPRTGRTARSPWAQVTCVAVSALEANTASTAAIVLAEAAPGWLEAHGIPARLDHLDGSVTCTPGWPDPADRHCGETARENR